MPTFLLMLPSSKVPNAPYSTRILDLFLFFFEILYKEIEFTKANVVTCETEVEQVPG